MSCKNCLHDKVCDLWISQERQCAANYSGYDGCDYFDGWVSVDDKLPDDFVSVLGHMTDAGEFPAVRECYLVGTEFFFPALTEFHPVDKWMEMPKEG